MSDWRDQLAALKPCPEVLEWARQYDTPEAAWAACTRGEWMMRLIGLLSGPPGGDGRRRLVLCSSECARQGLRYAGPLAPACERCLSTVERWARREEGVTLQHVRDAADYVADSVTFAYAVVDVADAAYVDPVYTDACRTSVYTRVLRECADIVRKHYPQPPVLPEMRS